MNKLPGRLPRPKCKECSARLGLPQVFLRKSSCFSCKNNFCEGCITKRPDNKMCCRKCQILTASPLVKNDLLNLKSRDLVSYLTSRHISTSGCVEKEDLVNVLMEEVNGSSSSSQSYNTASNSNYSFSPSRNSVSNFRAETNTQPEVSSERLYDEDGIRIKGTDLPENEGSSSSSNCTGNSESDWVVVNENNVEDGESEEPIISGDDIDNEMSQEPQLQNSSENASEKNTPSKENTYRPVKLSDITCSADLDNMSVKELKMLLLANRTDFKGCVERAELMEKATRLWSDYTLSRRDLEKLSLEELCKICMDAPIECVLLECGHLATCMSCGKQLSECPVCRQYVIRCVRTFKV